MKFFKNLFYISFIAFPALGFAKNNPFPNLLCVDATQFWDGPYTVEFTEANLDKQGYAEIYDQSPEGRILVAKVHLDTLTEGTKIKYSGKNFSCEMEVDQKSENKKYNAKILFSGDEININGEFSCIQMGN